MLRVAFRQQVRCGTVHTLGCWVWVWTAAAGTARSSHAASMSESCDDCAVQQRIEVVSQEQDGVLSRRQLAQLGCGTRRVKAMVASRRWAAHGQQAIVTHCGPLLPRQQRWVAVINGGTHATLAGLTAAHEQGLRGFETDVVHLVLPSNAWIPDQDGVKVHVSRRFSSADRHPARRLPMVRLPRAIVDAATWSAEPRRASALIIAAVQQRLTTTVHLRRELRLAGRVRHRRLLEQVLSDAEGGVQALSELDFVQLCRRYSLPKPELQSRRRDATGRIRYLDVRLRRADGRMLNVELDGAAHFDVVDAWADMQRDLALLAQGEPTVRIPSAILRADPAAVASQIRVLLDAPW